MPRRYKMPDPDDRSPNNPAIILEDKAILDIYNRDHPDEQRQNVTEVVKTHIIGKALEEGWTKGTPVGNKILLEADIRRHN